jgi:putative SOS response-associated peptidase YedK
VCGRFALTISPTALAKLFELDEVPEFEPRYNIAPSQAVSAIIQGRQEAQRLLKQMRWGLIPFWAKDISIGMKLINARSETAAAKPAFRDAFSHKRCLIPASGFYEWQKQGKQKQPYFIRLSEEEAFAMAGLWQRWEGKDGQVIESCNILTTRANKLVKPIHDRMPVILPAAHHQAWLDTTTTASESLQDLLVPYPAETMTAHPVGKQVNRPAHDSPDCIAPVNLEDGTPAPPDLFS